MKVPVEETHADTACFSNMSKCEHGLYVQYLHSHCKWIWMVCGNMLLHYLHDIGCYPPSGLASCVGSPLRITVISRVQSLQQAMRMLQVSFCLLALRCLVLRPCPKWADTPRWFLVCSSKLLKQLAQGLLPRSAFVWMMRSCCNTLL